MKKLYMFLCLSVVALSGYAQQYVGGEKRDFAKDFPRLEAFIGWEGTAEELSFKSSSQTTSGAHGVIGRLLFYPLRYVALGVEGTSFNSQSFAPLVDKYTQSRVALLAKVHLSPNTNPRLYLLGGWGKGNYKLTYVAPFDASEDKKSISFWQMGLGIEADVYKRLFIALEGTLRYHTQREITRLYFLKDRWEPSLRLGLGLRF